MKIWGEIPKISGIYDKRKSVNKVESSQGITPKKDAVSISKEAKDFQIVMKALSNVPDVRQDKVSELTEKYQSGSYDVKGNDIADKIVKSVFDKKI